MSHFLLLTHAHRARRWQDRVAGTTAWPSNIEHLTPFADGLIGAALRAAPGPQSLGVKVTATDHRTPRGTDHRRARPLLLTRRNAWRMPWGSRARDTARMGARADAGDLLVFPQRVRLLDVPLVRVDAVIAAASASATDPGAAVALQTAAGPTARADVLPAHERYLFVCVHGARDDRCGACHGTVLPALRARAVSSPTLRVWGTSHVGGHAFAGNVLYADWATASKSPPTRSQADAAGGERAGRFGHLGTMGEAIGTGSSTRRRPTSS